MNRDLLNKVVNAVLYEGHILYPYRPSSKKNRQRFTFGRVYPVDYNVAQDGAEPCAMLTECLAVGSTETITVNIHVGFLQPLFRQVGELIRPAQLDVNGAMPEFKPVPELRMGEARYQTWHEAVERTVEIRATGSELLSSRVVDFEFPASRVWEPISDRAGRAHGVLIRTQDAIAGRIEVSAEKIDDQALKLRVRILNTTSVEKCDLESQEAILMRTFASTHTILNFENGAEFISLLDPPAAYTSAARQCRNIGTWPVLVGEQARNERDTMLSSPIILYDYPKIAPESPGDLFDGTEIDEILTLRILTMTDEEKTEMRSVDEHARRILERTETMSTDHLLKLHGTLRDTCTRTSTEAFFNPEARVETVTVRGVSLKAGDRVRIRPKSRADVMDIALAGKIGMIESFEHDVEDRIHFSLVIEDDPGRDLGLTRYPGHRFFFAQDEIELLEEP
jgi:hypothetical protein